MTLALFPAVAQAKAWEIQHAPETPVAGEEVAFHAERANPGNGDGAALEWDFGDGATLTGQDVTHTYTAEGRYTVTLSTPQTDAPPIEEDSVEIDVAADPNTPPSAAFSFAPASPVAGESVLFTGGSDPDGDPVTRVWDFGDSTPASSDVQASHVYAAPGDYTVSLNVTDGRGGFASTSQPVTVSPQPPPEQQSPAPPVESPPAGASPPADTGSGGAPAPVKPRRMRPFPVVRIAGVILPDGARVRILSVRAPRGARVSVRCSGRGCPTGSLARTSATGLVRLHRFERRLPSGVKLALSVRKADTIGKYTRFAIRAGRAPARVDRCLMPGRKRPVRCP